MSNVLVRMPYDPTGRNPDNLVGSEPHDLNPVNGFPYKIITLVNGGFYVKGLRVYDANYNRLVFNQDYIVSYVYLNASEKVGLDICSVIVFLDPARTGRVFVSAQMVGGDVAFSLTAIQDYISFYRTKPAGYIPVTNDYAGNEPVWKPGELDKERWHLDTFEPFNNEIYYMSRSVLGGTGNYEQNYRDKVKAEYDKFLAQFNDRLDRHIADKENPHVDLKNQVGLGLVENYLTATDAQARAADSNQLYMTPNTGYSVVDEYAIKPTNVHINNLSNPHKTTPDKIGAPTKAAVNAELAKKYGRYDVVANANYFTDGNRILSYTDFFNESRANIPAGNFLAGGGNGYLNPTLLANGTPSATTALRGDGRWVEWEAIMSQYAGAGVPNVLVMNFPAGTSYTAAYSAAISQPWAASAPDGSMILYNLQITYAWATRGIYYITHTVCYGAVKSKGAWYNVVTP